MRLIFSNYLKIRAQGPLTVAPHTLLTPDTSTVMTMGGRTVYPGRYTRVCITGCTPPYHTRVVYRVYTSLPYPGYNLLVYTTQGINLLVYTTQECTGVYISHICLPEGVIPPICLPEGCTMGVMPPICLPEGLTEKVNVSNGLP